MKVIRGRRGREVHAYGECQRGAQVLACPGIVEDLCVLKGSPQKFDLLPFVLPPGLEPCLRHVFVSPRR